MTYDPVPYWTERGKTYEARFRPERFVEQEAALADVLRGLAFESVLEVGCGFGRIRDLIARVRPDGSGFLYTGIDLSPTMLQHARERRPSGKLVETTLADFQADRTYDLVIAVEVLMHVTPADIEAAVRKLRASSARHVVTVDWTAPLSSPAPHNFLHDYQTLLSPDRTIPVGLQSIHVVSCTS